MLHYFLCFINELWTDYSRGIQKFLSNYVAEARKKNGDNVNKGYLVRSKFLTWWFWHRAWLWTKSLFPPWRHSWGGSLSSHVSLAVLRGRGFISTFVSRGYGDNFVGSRDTNVCLLGSEEDNCDVKREFLPWTSGEGGSDIFKVSSDEKVPPWVSGTMSTTKMVLAAQTQAK